MADQVTPEPTIAQMREALGQPAPVETPLPGEPIKVAETVEKLEPVSEPVAEPVVEAPKTEPVAPKPPKRFSELTRDRDAAVERARQLEVELAVARSVTAPKSAEPVQVPVLEGEPQPPDEKNFTGTWDEYQAANRKFTKDYATWAVQNARHQDRVVEAQAKEREYVEKMDTTWKAQYNDAIDADPDFVDVVKSVGDRIAKLEHGNITIAMIKESEVGVKIVESLGKDKELMDKLIAATPLKRSRMIGQIEAKIEGIAPSTPPARQAKLPDPPTSVGGLSVGVTPGEVDVRKVGDLPMDKFRQLVKANTTNKGAGLVVRRGSIS